MVSLDGTVPLDHFTSNHRITTRSTPIGEARRHFFAMIATLRWGATPKQHEEYMKKARLQKIVDHLRKVRIQIEKGNAPEFDMYTWGALNEPGVFKGKTDLKCVTSACAIGHTAHLFSHQGFNLRIDRNSDHGLIPVYRKSRGFKAISSFFDITIIEAEHLFNPSNYAEDNLKGEIPIGMVAYRIENFIHSID